MQELTKRGKKIWKYRRRVAGTKVIARMRLGTYPAKGIAVAREWARSLNDKTQNGIDPREEQREEARRRGMTVDVAHALYMAAVREGRASRAKRNNKPRAINDKLEIYARDIAPTLGARSIYDVTEKDLILLVARKGKTAKVRANRLAAELKVFFGWASGLRGLEVGLERDPSARLGDLRFPETARSRTLSLDELEWFLGAVAEEPRDFRRGMLVWLLTAARMSEVVRARADEIVDGIWTIPSDRSKNWKPHAIALGPWGRSLMTSSGEWVFPADKVNGPRKSGWYKARNRVHARMEAIADRLIERFTLHDFRRTARSNTKRLKVDFDTAEAMMNHQKSGLERIYDAYGLEDEKAAWFLMWEREIVRLARKAGVAEKLGVPTTHLASAAAQRQIGPQASLTSYGHGITIRYALLPAP
jgi:integrase